MMKHSIYYCLCNHWTESGIGYAFPKGWYQKHWYDQCFSSIYTIETTLDAADKYPGLKVCMELDSYTYEAVKKVAPATIQRLKNYIKEGKAAVEGGTYGQPLGQDYSGESNIAHLVYGRSIIHDLLDYDLKTFLVEEQWFHPQLPQLLKQSGFAYASLQCQNSGQVFPMEETKFLWKGIDGTTIESLPANRNMVSCVKQYGGYEYLWEHLKKQEAPLLFQWVEVWVPGMDWGASIKPFEAAIQDVFQHGAKSVSLQEYFEYTKNLPMKTVFLPLEESHYGNDWYQDGGWGFDGDRIIYENKQCENLLLAYEAKRYYEHVMEDDTRDSYWKQLMILQNHDVSVARGYRAVDQDGVVSDANSLFLKALRKMKKELQASCFQQDTSLKLMSYLGVEGGKTYALPLISKTLHVYDETHQELMVSMDEAHQIMYVHVMMLPYQATTLLFENKEEHKQRYHEGHHIRFEHISMTYEQGWCIHIKDHRSDIGIRYKAFSGSIGKRNEHDDHFHALSSAHRQFTFAFDGYKHCADQCSEMHVKLKHIIEDDLFITMTLSCDLLTLHTTDVPVAFAISEVKLNKASKEITARSYLYCGVYLNMDAYASFTYDMKESEIYRNYPFGEELTKLKAFYALDYVRVNHKTAGFTIMNHGNQRVFHEGQELRFKLSKGKMLYDYEFCFSISFETKNALESMRFIRKQQQMPLCVTDEKRIKIEAAELLTSSIFRTQQADHYRFVNYSDHEVVSNITLPQYYSSIAICDFLDHPLRFIVQQQDRSIRLHVQPMEIITVVCHE